MAGAAAGAAAVAAVVAGRAPPAATGAGAEDVVELPLEEQAAMVTADAMKSVERRRKL
jgi:hypothetical protein